MIRLLRARGVVTVPDGAPENPDDLGFRFETRKSGDVVILHHGLVATTLRGRQARAFSAVVARGDERATQQRMARLTGKDKRGNERVARQHPRNRR